MTRSEMFKRLALGGAAATAARAFPNSPQETAERVVAIGGGVPVAVNGPLHLHGDSHMITGCVFHMGEKVPAAIEIHDNKLLGGYS